MFCWQAIAANQWPAFSGKTLANTKVSIPNQESNMILILGFDMESADPMADWVNQLNLNSTSNIAWLQIPVIGGVPPFVDGFIKGGMKKSVPKHLHGHYFPYFGNKKNKFIETLTNESVLEDAITPFIIAIDKNGKILTSIQAKVSTENSNLIWSKLNE